MPLNHLIGLIKTALFNANKSEEKANEVSETLDGTESALDYVVEEVLPNQEAKNEELENAVDYILTEVIPSLMGGE